MTDPHSKNRLALQIFDDIADNYEWPANIFSLFQYGRWRRSLVSELGLSPGDLVLDVCTGTALVALELSGDLGCQVVGVDLSQRMLREGRTRVSEARLDTSVRLVRGRAESLPFPDGSFDAVVFTFLLRYVEDPQATISEMARVLRPGGRMGSLEFYIPRSRLLHALWVIHARALMPLCSWLISPGWKRVGSFLGPSITGFYEEHSMEGLDRMWELSGIRALRHRELSLGGAILTWGEKGVNP
jgi:demethylmenaquinone methyltransferase/2-methoxy-6-polyprenyl-1,4-benzoquinol methylase